MICIIVEKYSPIYSKTIEYSNYYRNSLNEHYLGILWHLYQEQSWFSNRAIHVIEQGSIGIHNVVLLNSSIATMRMTKKVITRLDLHDAVS